MLLYMSRREGTSFQDQGFAAEISTPGLSSTDSRQTTSGKRRNVQVPLVTHRKIDKLVTVIAGTIKRVAAAHRAIESSSSLYNA